MSDKKQTAVEWAFEQLTNIDWKHLSDSDRNDLFDQAKQIEREQIKEAYEKAFVDACNYYRHDIEPTYLDSEEYYDQTYGKHD
jgi:hypothetical protein